MTNLSVIRFSADHSVVIAAAGDEPIWGNYSWPVQPHLLATLPVGAPLTEDEEFYVMDGITELKELTFGVARDLPAADKRALLEQLQASFG